LKRKKKKEYYYNGELNSTTPMFQFEEGGFGENFR
jgi:hypothetical protein